MALVLVAGIGAGTVNAIVGSGTLITFPTLVAFGVPPVSATMSNALGLIPGNVTGSWGYRRELSGQRRRLLQLVPASLLGALTGAFLLLHLPEDAFVAIVPVLLVLALVLVVAQPALQAHLRRRRERAGTTDEPRAMGTGRFLAVLAVTYLCGVYGGYFAAAQGILLVGLLGLVLPETIQRINGAKNVLVLVVNLVAATTYVVVDLVSGDSRIEWAAVGLIAAGSLVGGFLGAAVGRRLPPWLLRSAIVLLGLVALYTILTL
ncbi:MAG: sulfite exporter TauE/SafE family protein [Nocardioidaceae bacterium]|nr:sulfite exporter TauE/SafE family protein [Nocardioidaceae bacterium]